MTHLATIPDVVLTINEATALLARIGQQSNKRSELMLYKRLGRWHAITSQILISRTSAICAALERHKIGKGELVLSGKIRPEWLIVHLAATAGGIAPAVFSQPANFCGVDGAFRVAAIDGEQNLAEIVGGPARGLMKTLEAAVLLDPAEVAAANWTGVLTLAELENEGRVPASFEQVRSESAWSVGRGSEQLVFITEGPADSRQCSACYDALASGQCLVFGEGPDTVLQDLQQSQPQVIVDGDGYVLRALSEVVSRASRARGLRGLAVRALFSSDRFRLGRVVVDLLVGRPLRRQLGLSRCQRFIVDGVLVGGDQGSIMAAICPPTSNAEEARAMGSTGTTTFGADR